MEPERIDPATASSTGPAAELDADAVELDLSRVEESLRLLDDPEVAPTDAVSWLQSSG